MKLHALLFSLLAACLSLLAQPASEPIDFNRARQLIERQRSGNPLTPDEQAYLARARAEREKQQRAQSGKAPGQPGGAPSRLPTQRPAPTRLTPLTDLGAADRYEGQDGGLYSGGRNTPPDSHRRAAEQQLAQILPLNSAGQPAADGLIGFVSLSMSNATQEFARFKQVADASPLKSPRVNIVDCAQGGQAMAEWAPADARPWQVALERLAAAKVTPAQVQVAWVKLANKGPTGSLEEHGRKLERDTLALLHRARVLFPNLRIAYLGSRTFGGYAVNPLNPEPYAYESAFPARWLIQRQVQGDAELALTRAPLLLWGPYLWADGVRGRKTDALVWNREDFVADGVHPSDTGRQKVADLLLTFLTTDPLAKTWFAGLAATQTVETTFLYPQTESFRKNLAEAGGRGLILTDYHIHIRGGMTLEKAAQRQEQSGIRSAVLENFGREWPLSDNAKLEAFISSHSRPVAQGQRPLVGIQVNDRDWYTQIDPALRARLDFILADTMIMGVTADGKPRRLWLPDVTIADPAAWMIDYLAHNLRVLDEPISILANPTYLPPCIASHYDQLWTEERMRQVIAKAVAKGVALEVQAGSDYPKPAFLKLAKAMGAKFSFGSNNFDDKTKDLSRWFQAITLLDLKPADLWVPKSR